VHRSRRLLAVIASAWLVVQAGALAAVPAVFWDTTAEDLLACTCGDGNHAICPMHHRPSSRPARCALTGTQDTDVTILGSLLHGVAVMPVPTSAATDPMPERLAAALPVSADSPRPAPPDPPPPRL